MADQDETPTAAVAKELLLKARVPEAWVEIPGVGSVRVRGLSRGEVFVLQKTQNKKDVAGYERKLIAAAMVEPRLTELEVQAWQEASPAGELHPVGAKIRELSGLEKTAEKEAVLDFRGGPNDGVRTLPGGTTEDDGGADPGDQ